MKTKLAMVTLLLATAITATGCNDGEVKPIQTDDGKSVIFSLKTDGATTDFYYTAEDLLADLRLSLETYVYVGNKEKPLPLTKKKFIIDAYNEYFNKLTNMWNGDWNLIKALGDVSTHKVQVEADKVVYSLTRKTED